VLLRLTAYLHGETGAGEKSSIYPVAEEGPSAGTHP
jgi:hypothetical protein